MIRHSLDDNTYQSFLSSRYCFTTQVRSFCVRYYRIRCYSRRIIKNGDQMRLMCDTCICLDICLQIHSQAFLKVSGWIAFAAAECKRNLFSLRIILLKTLVKKSHCYGYYFEIETMENLNIFQNKSNSYEAYYCNC